MNRVFLDTYALHELLCGNQRYDPFIRVEAATTLWNLYELYYALLSRYGAPYAESAFERFKPYLVDYQEPLIKKAAIFRLVHRKKRLSYVDCLGYVLALSLGVFFVTGDAAFEGLPNVEFVR